MEKEKENENLKNDKLILQDENSLLSSITENIQQTYKKYQTQKKLVEELERLEVVHGQAQSELMVELEGLKSKVSQVEKVISEPEVQESRDEDELRKVIEELRRNLDEKIQRVGQLEVVLSEKDRSIMDLKSQ